MSTLATRRRTKTTTIGSIILIFCFAATCLAPIIVRSPIPGVLVLIASVAWLSIAAYLQGDPRKASLARLMTFSSFFWVLQYVSPWGWGPVGVIDIVGTALFWITGAHTIFSYPADLKSHKLDRLFVHLFSAYMLATSAVLLLISRPEWYGFERDLWWPTLFPNPELYGGMQRAAFIIDPLCAVVFTVLVMRRLRKMTPFDRATMTPLLLGYCGVALFASALVASGGWYLVTDTYILLSAIAALLVPIGFAAAEYRRRSQPTHVINELHSRFSSQPPALEEIELALRRAFTDPSITVYFWNGETSEYVDSRGERSDLSAVEDQVLHEVNDSHGEPLALIATDPYLERHPESIDAALGTSTLALENARLQAVVRSQFEDMKRSRARIVEAALDERRRIERDLHDGVQQRLLALSTRIGAVRHDSETTMSTALTAFTDDVHDILDSLRELARGIHPTDLRQFGVAVAIERVVEHLPVAVDLDISSKRYSPVIESTAYFVICEGLTNAVKHARSTSVQVEMQESTGEINLRISDDGIGGARLGGGTGLQGLSDRVAAIGGALELVSREGTTLDVTIPLT